MEDGLAKLKFHLRGSGGGDDDGEEGGPTRTRASKRKRKKIVSGDSIPGGGSDRGDDPEKSKFKGSSEEDDPRRTQRENRGDAPSEQDEDESPKDKSIFFKKDKKPKSLGEIYSKIYGKQSKEAVLSKKEIQKSMSYIKTVGDRVLNKKMALKAAIDRVPWWMQHHLLDYVRHDGYRKKSYHRGRK